MSYKLQKPYTDKQRADFIVKYNHNKGLKTEETQEALYALEPFEKLVNGEIIDNTKEYLEEQAKKKRKELDNLSLTKREVFLALYKDKKITPEQLKAQITDPEALIEFEYANDYYRGNPLINLIGEKLGYTTEELDYLFQNGELPQKPATKGNPATKDNVNNSETDVNNPGKSETEKPDADEILDVEL